MTHESDYSALDRPEILSFIFYPRKDFPRTHNALNVSDVVLPVGEGVEICCRFYTIDKYSPTILYFHGNGETVGDHDNLAPLYNRIGVNFFVADYRGYGLSTGVPTISSMYRDAHTIYQSLTHLLEHNGYPGNLYLMGRSLGSASAVELAYHYQEHVKGLIIESGFADTDRLVQMAALFLEDIPMDGFAKFSNIDKISTIRIPTLIIHGERDSLLPLDHGKALYEQSASSSKTLLIIPGADHNDILYKGMEDYFRAIKELINLD